MVSSLAPVVWRRAHTRSAASRPLFRDSGRGTFPGANPGTSV